MATSKPAAKTAAKPGTEVAEVKKNEVGAVLDFSGDAGSGMEGATQESFAIPFLSVLQKGSPQVDEAGGAAIPGAKQGMFFDNVSNKMYDGKEGVEFVPCAYRRVFIRWGARGSDGAGFKGEMTPEQVNADREAGKIVELDGRLFYPLPDGTVNDKKCDRVSDTRNHYGVLVNKDGTFVNVLLSLTSTQIKKSKMLMSALASVQIKGAGGQHYTPPTFANVVKCTSIPESNDKGNWMGIRFELVGQVSRSDVYQAAKAFHASIRAGKVEAKYEDTEGQAAPAAAAPGAGGGSF